MKRVLVTGGAGVLGSHLCDRLIQEGHDVLCVDNFYTGTKGNVAHLIGKTYFELVRHDVTFPLYVEVDEIYNFACPASPIHYQFDPVQTTKTSVHGAINMLGLAKRLKARILQASTSEVYGDPAIHPQQEDYWGNVNPIGVRSYDEGKRCAETLFFDFWRQHRLSIKVIRIFNTYGPRMHPNDGRVVSRAIDRAMPTPLWRIAQTAIRQATTPIQVAIRADAGVDASNRWIRAASASATIAKPSIRLSFQIAPRMENTGGQRTLAAMANSRCLGLGNGISRISRRLPPQTSESWISSIPNGPVTKNSTPRHSHDMKGGCQSENTPERASSSCATESLVMNPG